MQEQRNLLAALLLCATVAITRAQEIQCTAEPPLSENNELKVPLNGVAFYVCEVTRNPLRSTESWLLDGPIRHNNYHGMQVILINMTDVRCILSENEGCDRMIAMFALTSTNLTGEYTSGCATIRRHGIDLGPVAPKYCHHDNGRGDITIQVTQEEPTEHPTASTTSISGTVSPSNSSTIVSKISSTISPTSSPTVSTEKQISEIHQKTSESGQYTLITMIGTLLEILLLIILLLITICCVADCKCGRGRKRKSIKRSKSYNECDQYEYPGILYDLSSEAHPGPPIEGGGFPNVSYVPQESEGDRRSNSSRVPQESEGDRRSNSSRVPQESEGDRCSNSSRVPQQSEGDRRSNSSRVPQKSEGDRRSNSSRVPQESEGDRRSNSSRVPQQSEGDRRSNSSHVPQESEGDRRPNSNHITVEIELHEDELTTGSRTMYNRQTSSRQRAEL